WEEFKDLQIAFLKASVSDAEIPTDVAIHGLLHRVAAAEGVRYIVFAHSFQTEGFSPLGWSYMDGRYIESVHKKFGHRVLKTYPNFTLRDYLYYRWVKGIKVFPLLAYVPYRPEEVRGLLEKELDWQYYGGHHHESYYTHFFHSYYLPKKFGVDKRKLTYSALIRSGQITRREVLDRVLAEAYPYDEELVQYTVSKLGLSPEEFRQIMAAPRRTFHDYPTYYPLIKNCRGLIALAARFNIFPKHLYLKYLG
ncbi:MAG: N-acetyl sugar amidotransferase, partial [Omnitrophica WOR_2 bacterium RIFCSPHIGHO2_01_FULL_48_9]